MEDPHYEPVEAKVVCIECKRLLEYFGQKQCPLCNAYPLRVSSYQRVTRGGDPESPKVHNMYLLGG